MALCAGQKGDTMTLRTVDLKNMTIHDRFWDKYRNLIPAEVLPYQWKALNDEVIDASPSHAIRNFRIAAGLEKGAFYGFVFQDSDVAKWLEAAAYSLSWHPDAKLEKQMDEVIELIGSAQQPDGYLDTCFIITDPGREFMNLMDGHELYCAGHMIEAGVAYYQVTGKKNLLDICIRLADHIVKVFHEPPLRRAIPGHEEIELALFKLYRATGKKDYLEMAKDFLDRRGVMPSYFAEEGRRPKWKKIWSDPNTYELAYSQADEPVRLQRTARGHAVRAVYLYSAMADVAGETGDEELLCACKALYKDIVEKKMYITGGIGSSGHLERFTTAYDLPNSSAYAESCASIGLALFCRRMAAVTGEAHYMDTAECALYNTVLSGIAMDGKSFFYVNPLEVWPDACMEGTSMAHVKPVRQKWFGCACCPPNIARTLASLQEYCIFEDERGFYLNLFISGETRQRLGDKTFLVKTDTRFPFDGQVTIRLEETGQEDLTEQSPECQAETGTKDTAGCIRIRIPGYVSSYRLERNGIPAVCKMDKGYAVLEGPFEDGDTLVVCFDIPCRFVYANLSVRSDAGKAALMKGPLVYCLEEEDNQANLSSLIVDTEVLPEEVYDENLLGGTTILKASGWRHICTEENASLLYSTSKPALEKTDLTYVPYACWGNRHPGEMSVWVRMMENAPGKA